MIKQSKKQMLMLAAIASIGLSAPSAFAQVNDVVVAGKGEIPYVIDARNVVARSGTGLCWRTGYWSPAAASTALAGEFPVGCACDKDIVPADKCVVKAAAPAPAPKPTADKVKLSADALFDFDKAVLRPEGRAAIDSEIIAKLPQVQKLELVLVTGHTDRIGTQQYNQRLSERRADAVRDYLVSKGVPKDRIETLGMGKTQPVPGVSCNQKNMKELIACLQPNRRVEVEVKGEAVKK